MQTPSPYLSDRITFIDPWFVKKWYEDYKKFDTDKDGFLTDVYYKVRFCTMSILMNSFSMVGLKMLIRVISRFY